MQLVADSCFPAVMARVGEITGAAEGRGRVGEGGRRKWGKWIDINGADFGAIFFWGNVLAPPEMLRHHFILGLRDLLKH